MPTTKVSKGGSRFSIKSSERKSQEFFLFFCVVAALVVFVCLLVIYMTRKGLFTAAMLRERMQEKDLDSNSEDKKTVSSPCSNLQSDLQENPGISTVFEPEAEQKNSLQIQPVADSFQCAENSSENPDADTETSRKGKIADILATLESLKNEPPFFPENTDGDPEISNTETGIETPSAELTGTLSVGASDRNEESLIRLPELEELQAFPPKRLAHALLEERPQTAAMLLRQFSSVHSQAVLEYIPTKLRLGIESRMTSCTEPDREILRETASALLEHLEALETENALHPAESLFVFPKETDAVSKFRPLADALSHPENLHTSDHSGISVHEIFPIPENEGEMKDQSPAAIQESTAASKISGSEVADLSDVFPAGDPEDPDSPQSKDIMDAVSGSSTFLKSIPSEIPPQYTADPHAEILPFDALKQFSKKDLRVLLAANPQPGTILALLGAEQRLTDRLLGVLPKSEANRVRKQLRSPGKIRLQDVEDARNSLMLLAHELADAGQIQLPETAESI